MLSDLHHSFTILASENKAASDAVERLKERCATMPDEYYVLAKEVTELEVQHVSGQYIRIWGPDGCIDQDEGYEISRHIPGAIPIGDDGGGQVIVYMEGHHGFGLYHVQYGDLDPEDATWIAHSLKELLCEGKGVTSF